MTKTKKTSAKGKTAAAKEDAGAPEAEEQTISESEPVFETLPNADAMMGIDSVYFEEKESLPIEKPQEGNEPLLAPQDLAEIMVRITGPPNGIIRGGRRWTGVSVVALDELSDEQMEAILADPLLRVEEEE